MVPADVRFDVYGFRQSNYKPLGSAYSSGTRRNAEDLERDLYLSVQDNIGDRSLS